MPFNAINEEENQNLKLTRKYGDPYNKQSQGNQASLINTLINKDFLPLTFYFKIGNPLRQ